MTAPLQTFTYTREIQPEDQVESHVNFACYLAYFGEAFRAWYAAMGLGLNDDRPDGNPLMAHLEVDYHGEMFYPGTALCRLTVVRVGRSSLEHRLEIFDAADPAKPRVTGRSVNVWRDRQLGAPAPWPAAVLSRCWAG